MDGFFIALISFFGGLIVDRMIIACRRRSAKNDNNSSNSHNEEKTEVKQEIKQDKQKNETEKDEHMEIEIYEKMRQDLKTLHEKMDKALEANNVKTDETSKSEVLISKWNK